MIDLPVAILCGGKGTRLGALTAHCPKALVKVAGEPFLAHQLDILAKQGCKEVTLCVGHFGDKIEDEFGGSYDGIELSYCSDGLEPLGQLGAVRRLMTIIGPECLFLYGDSYLPVDYAPVIERGRKNKRPAQATWNGTDYGLTYMTAEAAAAMPAFATMSNLTIYGLADPHPMPARWHQIGDLAGLREVEFMLTNKEEFTKTFLAEVEQVAALIDQVQINALVSHLGMLRDRGGRLFILGNGGSSANASHACNDFRKLCEIDAYTMENVAEITARVNDDGWRNTYAQWLRVSKMGTKDCLLVLSVGGGQDVAPAISVNIAYAVQEAKRTSTAVLGICGRDGGYTARNANVCVIVPTVSEAHITPHSESFQSVILHLLVSHPALKRNATKW